MFLSRQTFYGEVPESPQPLDGEVPKKIQFFLGEIPESHRVNSQESQGPLSGGSSPSLTETNNICTGRICYDMVTLAYHGLNSRSVSHESILQAT